MATQEVASSVLQQFVDRAGSLYSLPAVAVEVLDLTAEPNIDTVALRECVERDPALVVRLLRVVNSSLFGLSRQVSDLTQALALLGVKPLKLLVLGFSLPKGLYAGIEAETLQRYWRFTLIKAVTAREISKTFLDNSGDEAFIAGMLQEVGVLVLVNELGDPYINFLASVGDQGTQLLDAETATLGFDHAILSARLLEHWQLPPTIVAAVGAPYDPAALQDVSGSESRVSRVLQLATLVASILVYQRHDAMTDLCRAAQEYWGISVAEIEEMLDRLQAQVELMASLFSVPAESPRSYREILEQAHQQMSQAALDVHARDGAAQRDHIGVRSRGVASGDAALQRVLSGTWLDGCATLSSDSVSSDSVSSGSVSSGSSPTEASQAKRRDQQSKAPGAPVADLDCLIDPGLVGRLKAAIIRCAAQQSELSLLLVQLNGFNDLLVRFGHERASRLVTVLNEAIESLADLPCECLLVDDARVAVILPDCDRGQAVTLARTLRDATPVWVSEREMLDAPLSMSLGVASVAMPNRTTQPHDVIEAADRCLFAARRSGGQVVKSIDVL